MPRSRSRSPRDRDRDRRRRSRSRDKDRDRDRDRKRSRSPRDRRHGDRDSSRRHRDRSRDYDRHKDKVDYTALDSQRPGFDRHGNDLLCAADSSRPKPVKKAKAPETNNLISDDPEAHEMAKLMGFAGFETTKNKHVEANKDGPQLIFKARKYRQYMNRKGGFNRPLDGIK